MTDPTAPLAERLADLGAELNCQIDRICEGLFLAEVEATRAKGRDERVVHWRADGRADAYRRILLLMFGLTWADIAQRRIDHQAAARAKAKAG